jgi:hypothetical protein
MNPKEKRAVAAVIRRLGAMMADRRALITILRDADQNSVPPHEWPQRFHQLQKTPEYLAFLAQFEPVIARLKETADLDEVMPLLQKLSEGKLPN